MRMFKQKSKEWEEEYSSTSISRYEMKKKIRRKKLFWLISIVPILLTVLILIPFIFPSTTEIETSEDKGPGKKLEGRRGNESEVNYRKEEKNYEEHLVEKGDTLYSISLTYFNSTDYQDDIARINGLHDIERIQEGMKLILPPSNEEQIQQLDSEASSTIKYHDIRPGDSLYRISMLYYGSPDYQELLATHNSIDKPFELKVGDQILIPKKPEEFVTDGTR